MSMTKFCEHDRILDNDERECVELDRKNRKNCHNDKRVRVNVAKKSKVPRFWSYSTSGFGHLHSAILTSLKNYSKLCKSIYKL